MNILLLAQLAETPAQDPGALSNLTPPIQIALLLGAMSFATALMVCVTAFTRIIIVLSFVRRALSTQEIPPNPVMLGLALFLTLFVMAPTFESINEKAIQPLLEAQEIQAKDPTATPEFDFQQAWDITVVELKMFMMANTRTDDLELFFDLAETEPPYERLETPLKIAVPAFIISELKTAFIMGFCIYIPFLLIDLVVSTILMSLGMMMMPPVVVSTPCKILLFVLVDGWQLICKSLVSSFVAV
ncbi:flagellar type III secretion system pore protein FliP [Mariniblastus fucicola]|uniref:Flagellar biosynthetic protein FliP n=1 Tax=Mariniblastus fucicola TaxID=980251 RepID=A0A5B9PET2_9BACT|nr:flagellar type III secretion system pore protein FliP [Mariniblastus fucicola]QEG23392.1 Flagellar biosynthetic protein FliP precursor [Mariniblastus fucicola]